MSPSRRSILKTMAASAAAPFLLPSRVWSAPVGPNSKLTMGFIGMGKQSHGLLSGFLARDTQVLAVCDVDTTRRNTAKAQVDNAYKNTDCFATGDFRELIARKDIDAVCIATPDHWHAIPMLAALRAGKDVYCEKPLTHNIHEAIEVIRAVEASQRVLQTGSMQRSSKEFRVACELVRNGIIGKITKVECQFGDPGRPCDLPEESPEPGLNWDMWCGPGPLRGYSSVLSPRGNHNHFPDWRNYKEYGGGMVCDWGAHHIDIAQWGLGMDGSGPVEVVPPSDEKARRGCQLVYANGIRLEHAGGFGVRFIGEDGEVLVNRGKFKVILKGEVIAEFISGEQSKKTSCEREVALMEKRFLNDAKVRLTNSKNHLDDFLSCVRSRTKPIASEIVGAGTAISCHLMNQSYYNHARLAWDPAKKEFTGGTGNPKWLTRDYRGEWKV